ncbi:MAG: hypothetical protein HY763_05075 [Planctomycetes bacterium]|nr:hypothetical protein [Planctomycetota bacterium]
MGDNPSPNGDNGRDAAGRFAPGNAGGPGNPRARHSAALRRALLEAVSDDDIRLVVEKLVELAKAGDLAAIRELLDRTIGRPAPVSEFDVPPVQITIGPDRVFPEPPGGYESYRAGDSPAEVL